MTSDDTKMSEPMSKEEMIDTLKGLVFGTFDRTTAKEREALDMAIKALEQQPCEDTISREDVRKLICQINDKYGYSDRFHEFTERCLQLPSVTPQPKMGQWNILGDIWECSRCESMVVGYDGLNYCPNCGAKMEIEE